MSTTPLSSLSQWWAHASSASNAVRLAVAHALSGLIQFGATWEAGLAAVATWSLRAIGSFARRLEAWSSEEPRTPQELLDLARSLERTQPNLAEELRFIALHRPEAAGGGSS